MLIILKLLGPKAKTGWMKVKLALLFKTKKKRIFESSSALRTWRLNLSSANRETLRAAGK